MKKRGKRVEKVKNKKTKQKTKNKKIEKGTVRIFTKDLSFKKYDGKTWRKTSVNLDNALKVAKLFVANKNFDKLIDTKDPKFLKGELRPDKKVGGARIKILPDGTELDKAYSIFAQDLTIHDQTTDAHWDVLFKNPGGTYCYLYSLEKIEKAIRKKYNSVEEFDIVFPKLKRKVLFALSDKNDNLALPMFTLLKTYMRVGNEIYYKAHGHKGLTTLKKHDIKIEQNTVYFDYIGKDGVPIKITKKFPESYIKRLKHHIKKLDKTSFVFCNSHGNPLHEKHFKTAFRKYCGKEFYPHIVRSHYATTEAKHFLSSHKKATKEEIRELFLKIAKSLGHMKYNKKKHLWQESYNVTVHHYIQPEVVEKVKSLAIKD